MAAASVGALVGPGAATACTCVRFQPGEALRAATHVFAGTAVATRTGAGRTATVTDFRVDARVKGRVARRPAVAAPIGEAACGIRFRVGRRYLVFARLARAGTLTTNICTGTREVRRRGASTDALAPRPQCPVATQSASSPTG